MTSALWTPDQDRRTATRLWRFAADVGVPLDQHSYADLHRWSVDQPGPFWRAVFEHAGGIGDLGSRDGGGPPSPDTSFFPDASLNLAENYLRRTTDETALIFRGEDVVSREVSWAELWTAVGRCQRALIAAGVVPGDRVATVLPNGPEAVIVFLAAAATGAVYSSTSPDFGADGVLDRFGQIEPKVLVATDGYSYSGTRHDITDKVATIAAGLSSLSAVVIAPFGDRELDLTPIEGAVSYQQWTSGHGDDGPVFERLGFDQPIYILYSSGTTGKPKCIVHRAGGVLLKHWSELQLHCDLRPGDRMMYFTTTGWMMWNWLVAGLSCELTLVLYDGSPFHPTPTRLFDLADELGPRLFGVSAKYIEAIQKEGLDPISSHDLTSIDVIASTGSPLAPEGFEYLYDKVKTDVHLASFSGGTDICGCFVTGDPTGSVFAGEIQVPALGLDTDVAADDGSRLAAPAQGELVCRNAFPSMPLQFWNDPGHQRYRAAYFDQLPGMWHHGDYAEWTPNGGMVITGRSDATLNPGGVRIGTAEIYRQVDLVDEVLESVVIGQQIDADTRVVLFVKLRDGLDLDDELVARIRRQVREGASPRHVPAVVAQVPTIPRTRSGKLVELAIREVVHGREIKNAEAIDDVAALDAYRDHPALRP
jgi:acetoacetyl-CoA synthetase